MIPRNSRHHRTIGVWLLLLCLALAAPAVAQPGRAGPTERPDTVLPTPRPAAVPAIGHLVTVGSAADDRARVAQILGAEPTAGYLIRSPVALTPPLPSGPWLETEIIAPQIRSVWNSAVPYSLNEGLLWAGRGMNLKVMAGVRARLGRASLTLAPEVARSQNRDFQILPEHQYRRIPGRSPFASIWHVNEGRVDMPYRFGDSAYRVTDWGQSALDFDLGPLALGLSTENQWWGPGIRNAVMMSNNAPGFANLYLRTPAPIRTRIGDFETRWLIGWLRDSPFYEEEPLDELRSLSSVVLTLTPRWEPNLTLGAARSVYSEADDRRHAVRHATRVFRRWEQRRDSIGDYWWEPPTDQILGVFARWVFPRDGFEVYGEWARHELPLSFRDFLEAPHHSRGYSVGLQWARPVAPGVLRLQGELTQLEQSNTFKQRPIDTFYTGRASHQGYTNRGQVLGAAIGPGSSSQWVAADLLGDRGQVGLFAGRVRWENDALYSSPSPRPERGFHRTPHAHDVSVMGGVRGGYAVAGFEVRVELTYAHRYNYLFQNPDIFFGPDGAVDIVNRTIRIDLSPARPPRLVRGRETS